MSNLVTNGPSHGATVDRAAHPAPWTSQRLVLAVVFLVSVLVYANSLTNGFAYDDLHIVQQNEAVHSLSRVGELVTSPYWPGDQGHLMGLWRPAATTIYAVLWAAGDGSAFPFHLTNVLLHAVVSLLVVLLLLRFVPLSAAAVGGLLFAVHPVHVEAVANIVGFAEIFTAFTTLSACLLYARAEGRPGPGTVLAIAVLFGLGMLTKESAAVLPALLVLMDAYRRDLRIRDLPAYLRPRWRLFTSIVGVGAAVLATRAVVLEGFPAPLPPMGAEILTEIPRIWTVPVIWLHYVRLLFFPLDLSADYSPGVIEVQNGWSAHAVIGVAVGLVFLAMCFHTWRQGGETDRTGSVRAVGAGILWFIIAILPASNVVFLAGTLLGERLLYLPSVGFCLAAGWVFHALVQHRKRVAQWGFAAVVLLFSARTWTRNPTWASMTSVFEALANDHPEAGRAQWIMGDQLWGHEAVTPAFRMYRLALGTLDNHYPLMIETTRKLLGVERPEAAEALARMAWEQEPNRGNAPGLLALALMDQERFEEAIPPAQRALELSGGYEPLLLHILSRAHKAAGQLPEAIRMRQVLIDGGESGSPFHDWYWLSELYLEAGQYEEATLALTEATSLAANANMRAEAEVLRERIREVKSTR